LLNPLIKVPDIDPSAGKFVSCAKEGRNIPYVPANMQTNPPQKLKHTGQNVEHEPSTGKVVLRNIRLIYIANLNRKGRREVVQMLPCRLL